MISWIQTNGSSRKFEAGRFEALEVGTDSDGSKLYVGRAPVEGGLHIGKINANKNRCLIPLFGDEYSADTFEVLSLRGGVRVHWEKASSGALPKNPVKGGYNEKQQPTYVGRVKQKGGMFEKDTAICGEVVPAEGLCYVAYKGKEKEYDDYEVLCLSSPPKAAQQGPAPPPYSAPGAPPMLAWIQMEEQFNSGTESVFKNMMAFAGGKDKHGGNLYVGRAPLGGGCHVGCVPPSSKTCFIPLFGKEHKSTSYQVLVVPEGVRVHWERSSGGNVPPNAVVGGYNEEKQKTYVGRVMHKSALTPGEIVPQENCIYIPYEGKEVEYDQYEVLVLDPPAQPVAPQYATNQMGPPPQSGYPGIPQGYPQMGPGQSGQPQMGAPPSGYPGMAPPQSAYNPQMGAPPSGYPSNQGGPPPPTGAIGGGGWGRPPTPPPAYKP